MLLALLSAGFQSLPLLLQANWALLVLIPVWVGLCMFYDPVSLSNELSCEAGSFSPCVNTHKYFQSEALRMYFPMLGPWVTQAVSLPSCSSHFICMQMWDRPVYQLLPGWVLQLPPCRESSPPDCHLPVSPSPALLPVWMNVSSLNPWLLDFHTVRFSVSSGCL